MEELEDQLGLVRRQLQSGLARHYEDYIALVESVINGRISRKEAEPLLARILPRTLQGNFTFVVQLTW